MLKGGFAPLTQVNTTRSPSGADKQSDYQARAILSGKHWLSTGGVILV